MSGVGDAEYYRKYPSPATPQNLTEVDNIVYILGRYYNTLQSKDFNDNGKEKENPAAPTPKLYGGTKGTSPKNVFARAVFAGN